MQVPGPRFDAWLSLPSRLGAWLGNPFPLAGGWGERLGIAGATGGFVALFLWAFRPFDIALAFQWAPFALVCLGYGALSAAAYLLMSSALVWMGYMREARWTLGRELLSQGLLVSFIALANMVYTDALLGQHSNWERIGAWLGITWQVAAFPIVFNTTFRHYFALRRQLAAAQSLDAFAHRAVLPEPPHEQDALLCLVGKNRAEELRLPLADVLAIEARGNYLKVFFRKNGLPASALIRLTLQEAVKALPPEGPVQRCHRSFVVNLNHVSAVSGNAQGIRLEVEGMKEPVPVSRAYVEPVRARLRSLRA